MRKNKTRRKNRTQSVCVKVRKRGIEGVCVLFQVLSRTFIKSTIVSIELLRKLSSSRPSWLCVPMQHRGSPTGLLSDGQNGTPLSFRQYEPYALQRKRKREKKETNIES